MKLTNTANYSLDARNQIANSAQHCYPLLIPGGFLLLENGPAA